MDAQHLTDVLEAVKHWPPDARVSLARMILETIEGPQLRGQTTERDVHSQRGKPVELLIGLGAGNGPPPSDDLVRQWIDEHRAEKYGT